MTQFTGYSSFKETAKVLAIVSGDELCSTIRKGQEGIIVLDKTPFYAEMGGQVADHGTLKTSDACFNVTDVHKSKDGKYMHTGIVVSGELAVDDVVEAAIDAERRQAIMRAHSATHLLQKALRNVLGTHIEQAGSLVEPDALRFDFTHFAAISKDDLSAIELELNKAILNGYPITVREMPIDEAKKEGAMALFGEKYGDIVRVVKMGDYSIEFCGGTHLDNTAKIGSCKLISEFSVAAGVRRIEAVVGLKTIDVMNSHIDTIADVASVLKSNPAELFQKAKQHMEEIRELKASIEDARRKLIKSAADDYLLSSKKVGDLRVVTAAVNGADSDWLRKAADFLRDKEPYVVAVLAAVNDSKITFLAACGKGALEKGVRAGDLIKKVTSITGGSGGGKPDVAMGGGKDPLLLDNALAVVDNFVAEIVEGK